MNCMQCKLLCAHNFDARPTLPATRRGSAVVDAAHAHLRMVTRGEEQGPFTEILSGLSANEKVVAAPGAELRDGAAVEVRP